MKTIDFICRYLFFLFLALFAPTLSYAQLEIKSEVSRPSASVSEYTRYGKYDPQLYSGKVSVSVPIYTLIDEDFTIPISLDYSYNGFVPNIQASEVGLGWTLSCGGFITREVRGVPDEGFTTLRLSSALNADLYGFDFLPSEYKMGYLEADLRYQYLENEDTPENILRTYIFGVGDFLYDGSPDIYHFTFLGRSGSFVIDNETGMFRAYNTSTFDSDYKIEKTTYTTPHGGFLYTSSFTITTSDGYHYVFGDASDTIYDSYTERRTLIGSSSPSQEEVHLFNYPAIAWALRKIVAPNGREVSFYYNGGKDEEDIPSPEGKDEILTFSHTVYSMSPSLWLGGANTGDMWNATSSIHPHEQLNSKCLLSYISSDTFELVCDYEEKSTEQIPLYNKGGTATRLSEGFPPMLVSLRDQNRDTLATLSYRYNPKGNPYPFLTNVTLPGHGSYSFDYKDLLTRYLPPMGTIAMDHWGYLRSTDSATCNIFTFNSSSIGIQDSAYDETPPSLRNASFGASEVGLMTEVVYPTGGRSTFEWEANRYRVALVKTSSNNFVPRFDTLSSLHTGPGGRIKKIVNYDSDGTPIDSTLYNYITAEGTESGILLRSPRYSIFYDGTLRGSDFSFYYVTTGGLSSFDAVPVEYPRVEELLSDSSRIIHNFSNYTTHPDTFVSSRTPMLRHKGSGPDSYVNMRSAQLFHPTEVANILRPTTSRQLLRGKVLSQVILDKNSDTLKTTTSSYISIGSDLPHRVYVGEAYSDVGLFGGGCYPFVSTTTDYLDDATVQSSSVLYGYNSGGQTAEVQQSLSNGDVLITSYRYAADMINDPIGNTIYHRMIADNVIGFPIEVEQRLRKNGESTSSIVSRQRYTFQQFTVSADTSYLNFYKPVLIEQYDTQEGEYYVSVTLEYDPSTGYLCKKIDANGSVTLYEWSSLGVTKITENAQESESRRQVWRFTYHKHNLPLTITDPSGRTVYYAYDKRDRLLSVTNAKGEKVEEYYYNTLTQ